MAKEEKEEPKGIKEAKPKGEHERGGERKGEGGKKKKLHLHQIVTTQAHDGTFGHEHIYKDKKEDQHAHPPVFAGTSQNMEDLHQHMDDHFGPQANAGEGEPDGDEQPEGGEQPAPAAGGAPQGE